MIIPVALKRSPVIAAVLGIVALAIAVPLFAKWVFFTAERLTWYAGAFFLLSSFLYLFQQRKK